VGDVSHVMATNVSAIGDEPNEMPPLQVSLQVSKVAVQVSAGGDHTCMLMEPREGVEGGRTAHCFGGNRFGQLGYNTSNVSYPMPPQDIDLGREGEPVQVMASEDKTCAVGHEGGGTCG
jgi:alpha-tubulin suppressor-like RCC1 family protein